MEPQMEGLSVPREKKSSQDDHGCKVAVDPSLQAWEPLCWWHHRLHHAAVTASPCQMTALSCTGLLLRLAAQNKQGSHFATTRLDLQGLQQTPEQQGTHDIQVNAPSPPGSLPMHL